jgi:hypothetical protein
MMGWRDCDGVVLVRVIVMVIVMVGGGSGECDGDCVSVMAMVV